MSGQLNGKRIKIFLLEQDMSRTELANQLGISGSLMNQMLAGRVPQEDTVKKLAQLMGCGTEMLITPGKANRRTA